MLFIIIAILLIFHTILFAQKSRSNRTIREIRDQYWKRERQANLTPKKDLSSLDYILIPIKELPFVDHPESKALENIQKEILNLSKEPIVNIGNVSNTDLKLKYGVANLKHLILCDNNYINLIRLLQEWGLYYYDCQMYSFAQTILEYAISCKTDLHKTYILVAKVYLHTNQSEKIDTLIETITLLKSLNKEKTIISLKELKYTSYIL